MSYDRRQRWSVAFFSAIVGLFAATAYLCWANCDLGLAAPPRPQPHPLWVRWTTLLVECAALGYCISYCTGWWVYSRLGAESALRELSRQHRWPIALGNLAAGVTWLGLQCLAGPRWEGNIAIGLPTLIAAATLCLATYDLWQTPGLLFGEAEQIRVDG